MDNEKTGAELIAAERQRQIDKEGWTPEHDDTHSRGQLLMAAVCYMWFSRTPFGKLLWPWADEWWKPTGNRLIDLTKAGALIAAEIDREKRDREVSAQMAEEARCRV